MTFLKKQLVELEKSIQKIIKENEKINQQFELAKSVPGVGPQTAINLIVATRCFSTFEDWRKLENKIDSIVKNLYEYQQTDNNQDVKKK